MLKAISIETSQRAVVRVLAIAEPEIIECNPTQNKYFIIEDYTNPPELKDLDKAYPVYNKVTKTFKWAVVEYQITAPDGPIDSEVLKQETQDIKAVNAEQQETIDLQTELLADILGGAI